MFYLTRTRMSAGFLRLSKGILTMRIYIFLGDGEDDFDAVIDAYPHIKYERVCGNCDWYSNYPDKMEIEFAAKEFSFLTATHIMLNSDMKT